MSGVSISFSPVKLQLLRAEQSSLSLDFQTDSKVQIFDIEPATKELK